MTELERYARAHPGTDVDLEVADVELSHQERARLEFTMAHVPADAETALEIGFGDFRMTRELCEMVSTTALDLPRSFQVSPEGADLVFGSIDFLPFADGEFDLAVCCEVLEHLPDPTFTAAVRELQRVAVRYLLLTVPYRQRVWNEQYKCPSCGVVWHYSDHCRTFDESLPSLFPGWKPTVKTFGETRGYAPDFLYRAAAALGNVWAESPWGCHVCKATATAQKPNALGFVLQRILWRWQARAKRRPIWMLVLLERV